MSSHTLEGKKKTQNGVKRLAFTVLSILLEVVFLIGIFKGLNEYAVFIDNLTRIFAVILVLKIYGRNETSSMKTPWIILILTFPILGVALYFMIGMNGGTRKMRMRYKRIDEKLLPLLPENKEVLERLNVSDPKAGNVSNYIERNACYPVYQNTDVTYFDEAVKGLEAQLVDLAKAEQFIFMEYHAIEDEYAWSRIQTVLEERVKAGVEVRVFYDDMGSIGFVNLSFARKLEAKEKETFWMIAYIILVLLTVIKNTVFQKDLFACITVPLRFWYRYIEWLIHPSELNILGEREYFSAGWSWFLRIMAILIFLGLGISSEIFVLRKIEQYRKAWDKYSIWILLISVSSIAVIGDVVRKYFPINLILLLGLINIAAMEIKIYCHNKRELY